MISSFILLFTSKTRSGVVIREFPYEGQRWFDLVRMGGAKEAMKAEGHIIQDYQFLYPIPKTELERINNTELLWQNTGY